ncbi:unnamed protein product [Nippostrongylus brasiliensis]|uniref:Integrase catalytic domain-containing protein n=1 Tax=Nippostrongylus brasiliensis TaxID=27835 RepID=A0A0N4YND2_NIPBR|nr:unnamed protein product [Nippostrongylus brasiliensis]
MLTPTIFGYTVSGSSDKTAHSTDENNSQCSSLIIATPSLTSKDDHKENIKNLHELESLGIKTDNDTDESLQRILQEDTEKFELYNDTLKSYLQEGIIEEARENDNSVATFYLPHRHLWTPSKSTKLRIAFDASSHAKKELSLNDVIYEGNSLTPLIYEVLLKFRTHLFTMVADIQKAFLQSRLPENHRDVTRFRSLYVDNVFLEENNAGDLLDKYTESKKIFSAIGMNLRDYLSNSAFVNKKIPDSDRAAYIDIKVLGVQWDAAGDTIPLKCAEKQSVRISKRSVLCQLNGYGFDPLGLLTPLLTPTKIFLQDLHKKKYGWDVPLSADDEATWRAIHSRINGFEITLPRKVMENHGSRSHTLSVFVDSSKRAYACSIYFTSVCGSKKDTRLFTAKSKIVPINKEQTIPRLELLSIFIGISLVESTIQKVDAKFDQINIFSDSTIALCWVQGNRRLPTVVSSLIQKISVITKRLREDTKLTFYHVPTNENVTDCATRGVSKEDLNNHRWWNGPIWLNKPNENWPIKKAEDLCQQSFDSEEEVALYTSNTEENTVVPIWPTDKFSSYSKLLRVVAYCARFIRNTTKGKCLPLERNGLQTTSPSAG